MKKGDRVFFYHTGKEKAVIGTATVSKTAYPGSEGRQPGGRRARRRQGLETPRDAQGDQGRQAIRDMPLVRIARLSVQPVTDEQWE